MAMKLNSKGRTHAASLIGRGQVDQNSAWSFSAADGDAILGDPPNWSNYSKWFLGKRTEADPETKQAWAYPFGKQGKVYRRALAAIRSRSSQQGHTDIYEAAGALLASITEEDAMTEPKTRLLVREEWEKEINTMGDSEGPWPAMVKLVTCHVKQGTLDPATGMYDYGNVISTEAVDRESDIIMQDGWDLSHYRRNPVVLWSHDYWSPPVAKSVDLYVNDANQLVSVDRFTPQDANPFGYMVYRLVQGGFLRAKSVGFRPLEYVINEDHHGFDFIRSELLEHSWVPVPANPEALIQAGSIGIDITPLRQWASRVLDETPVRGQQSGILPRNVLETIWKQCGYVIGSPTVVTNTATLPNGDDTTLQTHTLTWTTTSPHIDGLGGQYEVKVWGDGQEPDMDLEDIMDEAKVDELIAALTGTTAAVEEFTKAVATFAEGQITNKDTADDPPEEVDSAAVADLVKQAVAEAMTARTGQLPD